MLLPLKTSSVSLAACLCLAAGCAPAPRLARSSVIQVPRPAPSLECKLLRAFASEQELQSALPALWQVHQTDLIVLGYAVYASSCSQTSLAGGNELAALGGAGEGSRLGGGSENARLGGAGESSALGGGGESSALGGASQGSALGGGSESASLGGGAQVSALGGGSESSALGGGAESAKLGGGGESSDLGGASEDSTLGGGGESSGLGGAAESAKLGGSSTSVRCRTAKNPLGFEVVTQSSARVRVFDGFQWWRQVGSQFTLAERN
jgi:hypothetical protein